MALSKEEAIQRRREAQKRYYERNKGKRARAGLKSRCKQFLRDYATHDELLEMMDIISSQLKNEK